MRALAAGLGGPRTGPARILHVLGALDRGGVETWLMDLAARLDPARWRFDFCTLARDPGRYAGRMEALGTRVWRCPRGKGFCGRLHRILREGGYPVVHSHVHHYSAVVLAVAQAAGTPVRIAHSHNTADGRRSTLPRRLYRTTAQGLLGRVATIRLACSGAAAEGLFGTAPGRLAQIVPYGTPGPAAAALHDLRRALGLGEEPVVGHVGRFYAQKNHAFLLDVALHLQPLRPQVRFLLAGDGPLRRPIEDRARGLGLSGAVVFCGLREDVPALMASAMDAFLLPSHHEGLPVALLEAQAAGLPSLVSTAVPPEAAVVAEAVEFLPLAAGPGAWAARLAACLTRGRVPRDRAAAQLAAAGCTIESSLDRLLSVYREALPA